MIRPFSLSVRLAEARILNRTVTLELTLFTFCPPGPLLRDAVKVNSFSGIVGTSPESAIDLLPLHRREYTRMVPKSDSFLAFPDGTVCSVRLA